MKNSRRLVTACFLVVCLIGWASNQSALAQNLRGKFIWSVPNSRVDVEPAKVFFRKSFEASGVQSGLLEITCDDGYRVYVNGKLVGSSTVWQEVIRYDISSLLRDGKNVVSVHAENASKSPAGLYCKLTIQMKTETRTIVSDKSWKFSPRVSPGWRQVEFDDDAWKNAFEQGFFGSAKPWGNQFNFKTEGVVSRQRQKSRLKRQGLQLVDGDRIVFLGGTYIEQMQWNGYLETVLTSQFPHLDLKFRNLGWSGDIVSGLSRAVFGSPEDGFHRMENDLMLADPTLVIACYGLNESFRGTEFLPEFEKGLRRLADLVESQQADLVFLSPMLMENLGDPLPDPQQANQRIRIYADFIRNFAKKNGLLYIDNLKPLGKATVSTTDVPAIRDRLTDDGMHPNDYGYWRIAPFLARKLGADPRECLFDINLTDQTYTATQSTVREIMFGNSAVEFTAQDDRLVLPPPPKHTPRGGKLMAIHDEIRIRGLKPGKYGLEIDGRPSILADHRQWAAGVLINRANYIQQVEKLRQTIIRKNEMFFHRYRPQNETYLFLFRKHEQGNNAVEIPKFDPIVEQLESRIAVLKKTVPVRYRLHRLAPPEKTADAPE